jgi:hypothetical protein
LDIGVKRGLRGLGGRGNFESRNGVGGEGRFADSGRKGDGVGSGRFDLDGWLGC